MRTLARESVLKFLFSQLFNPSDEGLFSVLLKDLNQDDKQFATDLLNTVEENKQIYLDTIEKLAVGYKLNRIFNLDKCVLMIALAELDKFTDTPVAVVINEAVNIVAKYSTEGSTDFVNGILAEYARSKNNG